MQGSLISMERTREKLSDRAEKWAEWLQNGRKSPVPVPAGDRRPVRVLFCRGRSGMGSLLQLLDLLYDLGGSTFGASVFEVVYRHAADTAGVHHGEVHAVAHVPCLQKDDVRIAQGFLIEALA